MSRLIAVLVCLCFLAAPVCAQDRTKEKRPPSAKPNQGTLDLLRTLDQRIDLTAFPQDVTFKVALDHLRKVLDGKLPIVVDRESFANDLGADAPDPLEEVVRLTGNPGELEVKSLLRLLLKQIGKGEATFLIKSGRVEIVTYRTATAGHLLQGQILASYEDVPLGNVLRDLSEQTGLTINLDPKVGAKLKTPITATFRNSTLEDALIAVAGQADLKFATLTTSVIVTTEENAYLLEREEQRREAKREAQGNRFGSGMKRLEAAQ